MGATPEDGPWGLRGRMYTEIVGFRRRVVKIISLCCLHASTVLLYNIGAPPISVVVGAELSSVVCSPYCAIASCAVPPGCRLTG
jgi:hypothetical protein